MSEENSLVNVVVAREHSPVEVGGQRLVLNLLEHWDELEDRQQKYLQLFASNPTGSRYFAGMELGYTSSEIDTWFKQEKFSTLATQVYDIYTDILKGIDFMESVENSKIRARVIQARENGGKYNKEKKPTTHQHLHLASGEFSLSDLLKK